MKTNKLTLLLTVITSALFFSCSKPDFELECIHGEGTSVEKEITLDNFSALNMASSFNVVVSQGEVQKVIAVGQQNIIDSLNTNVSGNQWTICLKPGCYSIFDLTVYVTVPAIDEIKLSGSGNVNMADFNQGNNLNVTITGSGNFTMNNFESNETLNATLMGSGNFYATQEIACIRTLNVTCSGSGNFNGYSILSTECFAKTMGSGKCFVYAGSKLNATITGSGDIHYKGNPIVSSSITGSGNLIPSN